MTITPDSPETKQEVYSDMSLREKTGDLRDVGAGPPDKQIVVGGQTARSGTWTVGARIISRIVDLVTMVVLAHLLHPKDFGLVAVFTAWRSIISVLAMSGVLLIVLPHLTQSTDTLTLSAGTLLAIFLAAGTYCAVLFSLWIAVGGPHGIEAFVANKFKALLHTRQQVPSEVTK